MDKFRSSSSFDEVVRVMAPNAPSDRRIVHAICPSQMGKDKKGPGEMGPSDTVNDIAALAALSDLDQEERIEKVIQSIIMRIWDEKENL